jgi:hypothetical protein
MRTLFSFIVGLFFPLLALAHDSGPVLWGSGIIFIVGAVASLALLAPFYFWLTRQRGGSWKQLVGIWLWLLALVIGVGMIFFLAGEFMPAPPQWLEYFVLVGPLFIPGAIAALLARRLFKHAASNWLAVFYIVELAGLVLAFLL